MARPRNPRPLPAWKNPDWQSDDWDRIETHLIGKREQIAKLLDMDPEAREARVTPVIPDASADKRPTNRYLAMRRANGQPVLVRSIDLVIDDMTHVLHDFVVSQVNGKFPMSEAKIRGVVEQIAKRESITEAEIERLPLPVLKVLADHYPLGREQFAPVLVDPAAVITAAHQFLKVTPAPCRGRPEGTDNIDAKSLVIELANIFDNCGTRKPGRNPVPIAGTHQKEEAGKFHDFLQIAVAALPDGISPTRLGGDVTSLARDAIAVRKNVATSKK